MAILGKIQKYIDAKKYKEAETMYQKELEKSPNHA
jgi:hypothetical protein